MKYHKLGRTGLEVSACCLGTMTWGQQNTQAEAFTQLDLALAHGVNFIDTAELYAIPPKAETQGATETIIGNWLKASGKRQDVILATKICGRSPMAWHRGGDEANLDNGWTRHSAKQIDYAVENSLRRLQTDVIDLYQLHWPDRGYAAFGFQAYADYDADWIAFEDILGALARHVEKGSIRHVGVSNESPWGVMRFLAAAQAQGGPRIASIQNAYNLVNRVFEQGLAEISLREDVGLLAYSPLAQGYLTGKYRDGALPAGSRKALFQRLGRYEGPGGQEAIHAYVDCAAAFGLVPEHLALRFCASRPFVTSTIIGATSRAQLESDLAAFDGEWTKEMEEAVNALHARYRNPCP